jgi:hypothetical protein
LADEQTLEISDLFAGFQRSTAALATLGVLYMLGMLAALRLVIVLLAGGGIAGGMMLQPVAGSRHRRRQPVAGHAALDATDGTAR